jgi:hypothetical protein
MASTAYQISPKSTTRFKSYWGGGTHRQTGDLTSLFSLFNEQAKNYNVSRLNMLILCHVSSTKVDILVIKVQEQDDDLHD